MGLTKAIADLARHIDALAEIQRSKTIQHTPQALALNEFHRDERGCAATVEVVNATNVLVCDSSSKPKFVFQTVDERRLIRDFRPQYLEGNTLSCFAIIRFENNTHAAHADTLQDLIA